MNNRRHLVMIAIAISASCGGDGPVAPADGTGPVVPLKVPLEIVPLALKPVANTQFAAQLSAQGGIGPYTWTVAGGALPSGLTLAASGHVTGTPTQEVSFTFNARVTDAAGSTSSATFSGLVASSGSVVFEVSTPPMLIFGKDENLSFQPGVQGGSPPYTFTISGLPAGVTFDPATGVLSGRPTATGNFVVNVTLKDATNATGASAPVTIMVVAALRTQPGTGASKYAGTWIGQFHIVWDVCPAGYSWYNPTCEIYNPDGPNAVAARVRKSTGFNLSIEVEALALQDGLAFLTVKTANFGHPAFGCSPCSPGLGTLILQEPPANANTKAAVGLTIYVQGLAGQGTVLVTDNSVGAVHMSSTGVIIGNSLSPNIQPYSWAAITANAKSFEETAEPLYSTDSGYEPVRTSWALVKSGL